MTHLEDIQRTMEQAKQQRAELVGASVRKHPIIVLLALAVPILLTQIDRVSEALVVAQQEGSAQVESRL